MTDLGDLLDQLDERVERVTAGLNYIGSDDYEWLVGALRAVLELADWYDGGGEGVPRMVGRGATTNAMAARRIREALTAALSAARTTPPADTRVGDGR